MKRNHKLLGIGFVVLFLSLLGYRVYHYFAGVSKTLLIGGSSTVHHYTQALAEAYMAQKRDTVVIAESGGSKPGLLAVKNGSVDIASMSRDLEDDEDDEFTRNYLIGKDAVGIVVHPSNPIDSLTIEQVEAIFTGAIDNWSSVGGEDGLIQVVTRTPDSTTLKGLNETVLRGTRVTGNAIIAGSPREMTGTVADNPHCIGFLALADLQGSVKAVKVNNVAMSRETILTDRYPISRSFYYVVYDIPESDARREQHSFLRRVMSLFRMDDETVQRIRAGTIQDFLDFVRSPQGQDIIQKEGAIGVY